MPGRAATRTNAAPKRTAARTTKPPAKPPARRAPKRPFACQRHARNIYSVDLDLPRVGDERWVLLQADIHFDNPKCDRSLLRRHLDEAAARDAVVIRMGDQLDLMGGKYDPRRSKGLVLERYNKDSYLRDVMEDYAEFHAPYAHLILYEGLGNHESSVERATEFPVLTDTCARLSQKAGIEVHAGGYSNWVRFRIRTGKNQGSERTMWQTHGYGGGGPVTKDMIQANRQGVFLQGVHLVASGHTHDDWSMRQATVRLNQSMQIVHEDRLHIKVGTYKQAWDTGEGGWELEKGHPPKPLGAMWLRFVNTGRAGRTQFHVEYDTHRAV